MKKTLLLLFGSAIVWLGFETFIAISYTGYPPLEKTGAPGEGLCTDCHTGNAVNSGGATVKSEYAYNGTVDSFYNPDWTGTQPYAIFSTLAEPGSEASGIEMTMVNAQGKGAGTFTANNTNRTAVATSNGKSYFFHKNDKNPNPGANDWYCLWDPPTTNQGVLTMYTAINGADDDNTPGGDYIYTLKSKIYLDPGFTGVEWQKTNPLKLAVFPTTVSDFINFSYTNSTEQQINIDLFDLRGNHIHSFINEKQHPGDYNLRFSFPPVSSGMYIVRMKANNDSVFRKIFIQ